MPLLPVITRPVENAGCCSPPPEPPAVAGTKFHFSMNVADLERSVAFYRVLFGAPPAKHYPDYAKFELEQPPVVFSLVVNAPGGGGSLTHLGFPVASVDEVAQAAQRLEQAGLSVSCQNGTVCGYARQDKIWIADPDHNYWEIYVIHEDIDPETVRRAFDGISPLTPPDPNPQSAIRNPKSSVWEHRVLEPVPDRIPHEDNSIEEVRLVGTFNSILSFDDRRKLLTEALRVLKPGGQINVHGLVSDRPIGDRMPGLPGVAALVKRIPVEGEPLREMSEAGFVSGTITKLPERAVFQDPIAEMREIKLAARKPAVNADSVGQSVVYKGPFAQAEDDLGIVYRRGERTTVTPAQWSELAGSSAASQFLFIQDNAPCGG